MLEAPISSVLRTLINRCNNVSTLPTIVQSPLCNTTTPSDELSYRDQRKPDTPKFIMQIVEAVMKQAHNTSSRLAIRVRHVLARGCVGLTCGNHDWNRMIEPYVRSSKQANSLEVCCGSLVCSVMMDGARDTWRSGRVLSLENSLESLMDATLLLCDDQSPRRSLSIAS